MKRLCLYILSMLVFIGCNSTNSNISKVYETDYPEGISIILHKSEFKDNIRVTDARLVNGKFKKQVQLVINNTSSDNYNIKLAPEWTDRRGMIISNTMKYKRIKLLKKSSSRVILNAPTYTAKDVLINIECANNCIED